MAQCNCTLVLLVELSTLDMARQESHVLRGCRDVVLSALLGLLILGKRSCDKQDQNGGGWARSALESKQENINITNN